MADGRSKTRSVLHLPSAIWYQTSGGRFGRDRADPGDLDVPHHAERAEQLQGEPADVELVPRQAVASGDRVRVVVVVPALAEREERDPPAVARVVLGVEAAAAPHVR